MKISLINHGCAKNLVDAELILGILANQGYDITLDDNVADIIIVNTCSFIHDAEKESIQSILQMVEQNKKVIVSCSLDKQTVDLFSRKLERNTEKTVLPNVMETIKPSIANC